MTPEAMSRNAPAATPALALSLPPPLQRSLPSLPSHLYSPLIPRSSAVPTVPIQTSTLSYIQLALSRQRDSDRI